MTAQRARREAIAARTLTEREWEKLLRQPGYVRPLEPVPPLHVMARRRRDLADDSTEPKENR